MELLASLKLGRVWGLQNFLVRGGTWSKGADMHGLRRAMSQRGRCVMMSGTSTHQESLPRRTPCPIVENRPFWPQKSFLWSASSLYAESFGYCSFGSNLVIKFNNYLTKILNFDKKPNSWVKANIPFKNWLIITNCILLRAVTGLRFWGVRPWPKKYCKISS